MRGRGPNTKNWSNNVNKSHGRYIMTPVEVGCRGSAGQSLGRAQTKIGIVGAASSEGVKVDLA